LNRFTDGARDLREVKMWDLLVLAAIAIYVVALIGSGASWDWVILIGVVVWIAFLLGFREEHRKGPTDPDSLAGGGETGGGDGGG
jgi:fatty acid desaturase